MMRVVFAHFQYSIAAAVGFTQHGHCRHFSQNQQTNVIKNKNQRIGSLFIFRLDIPYEVRDWLADDLTLAIARVTLTNVGTCDSVNVDVVRCHANHQLRHLAFGWHYAFLPGPTIVDETMQIACRRFRLKSMLPPYVPAPQQQPVQLDLIQMRPTI